MPRPSTLAKKRCTCAAVELSSESYSEPRKPPSPYGVSVLSSLSLSYSITTVVLSLLLTYTLLLGWHPTVSDTLRILNAAYDATR